PEEDVWLSLSNSLEVTVYYAAFLFLPRLGRDKRAATPAATEACERSAGGNGCDT
ncbi:MAG: hypothetical protein IIB59_07325, partial [Planctomycetes bacterium]|nr:hypothetical protein [Planctomycetota bacterium]